MATIFKQAPGLARPTSARALEHLFVDQFIFQPPDALGEPIGNLFDQAAELALPPVPRPILMTETGPEYGSQGVVDSQGSFAPTPTIAATPLTIANVQNAEVGCIQDVVPPSETVSADGPVQNDFDPPPDQFIFHPPNGLIAQPINQAPHHQMAGAEPPNAAMPVPPTEVRDFPTDISADPPTAVAPNFEQHAPEEPTENASEALAPTAALPEATASQGTVNQIGAPHWLFE